MLDHVDGVEIALQFVYAFIVGTCSDHHCGHLWSVF